MKKKNKKAVLGPFLKYLLWIAFFVILLGGLYYVFAKVRNIA